MKIHFGAFPTLLLVTAAVALVSAAVEALRDVFASEVESRKEILVQSFSLAARVSGGFVDVHVRSTFGAVCVVEE